MDKERLIKLLNLTQSPNDNEALAALRRVHKIFEKENVSWEKLFFSYSCDKEATEGRLKDFIKYMQFALDNAKMPNENMRALARDALRKAKKYSIIDEQWYNESKRFYEACLKDKFSFTATANYGSTTSNPFYW